jgi:hypothetical protein
MLLQRPVDVGQFFALVVGCYMKLTASKKSTAIGADSLFDLIASTLL